MPDIERLLIEAATVEHYKESFDYHGELREYATRAFLTFFDEALLAMNEKGWTLPYLFSWVEVVFGPIRACSPKGHWTKFECYPGTKGRDLTAY